MCTFGNFFSKNKQTLTLAFEAKLVQLPKNCTFLQILELCEPFKTIHVSFLLYKTDFHCHLQVQNVIFIFKIYIFLNLMCTTYVYNAIKIHCFHVWNKFQVHKKLLQTKHIWCSKIKKNYKSLSKNKCTCIIGSYYSYPLYYKIFSTVSFSFGNLSLRTTKKILN